MRETEVQRSAEMVLLMIIQQVRENPETQTGLTPKLMFVLRHLAGSSLSQTQLGSPTNYGLVSCYTINSLKCK